MAAGIVSGMVSGCTGAEVSAFARVVDLTFVGVGLTFVGMVVAVVVFAVWCCDKDPPGMVDDS